MNTSTMNDTLSVNKVLRNTYLLLSMTLLWSAGTGYVAIITEAPPMGWLGIFAIVGVLFGLMFARDTWLALPLVFLFTGTMGFFTGPVVNMYLEMSNGPMIVSMALGSTATIFLGLSGYALVTQKDFSYMGAFLFTGLLVLIGAIILSFFVTIPGLHLAISAATVFIFSGYILYDTSQIIHGGETNYVMATVNLYLDILNIFVSLLHLFSILDDD